jgi:DnaJ-domain-containing protein 1
MEGRFHVNRGSGSTAQGDYAAIPPLEQNRPVKSWQFVNDFQKLAGPESEPDPLFFVETWTLGMATAVENFQRRRQAQGFGNGQDSATPESARTQPRMPEEFQDAAVFSSTSWTALGGQAAGKWPADSQQEPAARTSEDATQEWGAFARDAETGNGELEPMTPDRACHILGVMLTSTPRELKAAYRQKVNQWHPDRLGRRGDQERELATRQMAAINEAYRLLRELA